MSVPFDEITVDTCCPPLYGGPAHYPQFRDGQLVTMSGLDAGPYRSPRLMLSLCETTYLLPPEDEAADTPRRLCRNCFRDRRVESGEVVTFAATA